MTSFPILGGTLERPLPSVVRTFVDHKWGMRVIISEHVHEANSCSRLVQLNGTPQAENGSAASSSQQACHGAAVTFTGR